MWHEGLQLDRVHDVDETGEEGPPRDHQRERGDGVEWSGEDEHAHGEGQKRAQQQRPPGTVIHSLQIVEDWGCHDASFRGYLDSGYLLDEAPDERESGICDLAPPVIDRERLPAVVDLDNLGHADVV